MLPKLQEEGIALIVTLLSGNGGAWKTTTAINLAIALRQRLGSVRLIDADYATGKVVWYLGQPDRTPGVNELVKGREVKPVLAYGVEVYPRGEPVAEPKGDFAELVSKLASGSDATIVDTRSGLDRAAVDIAKVADVVLLFTRPDASVVGALVWSEKLREEGKDFKLIICEYPGFSMKPDPRKVLEHERITVRWVCEKLGVEKPLLSLPWDPHAIVGNSLQHPVFQRYPNAPISRAYDKLAELIIT